MSKTVYEVQCRFCNGLFDTDNLRFVCPCQSKEGSGIFKKYWIACSVNPRHRYWSNRSEDCKFCLDEKENKKALITIEHKGLRLNGETIKQSFERPDKSLLTTIEIEQMDKIISKLKEDEKSKIEREELIIKLLQEINQKLTPSEPKELDDK